MLHRRPRHSEYKSYKEATLAGKPIRQTSPKKKSAAASETSESIAEQTKRFLKSGNKIEVVESGLSGQPVLGAGKPASTRA